MSIPAVVNVLRALIWETFWQAIASRIFWVLLTVTGVCILFCLSLKNIDGSRRGDDDSYISANDSQYSDDALKKSGVTRTNQGRFSLAFGAITVPVSRDIDGEVEFLQFILSAGVAGTLGILLTLVWTAGFLPAFLEPNAASVLLVKPVPRWLLLLGKFLGLNLVVALQAAIFVLGTWTACGIATNVWTRDYLLTIPLLMLQFAFFYSFSMFLAVATRSTVASMVGIVLFWLLCLTINQTRVEMKMAHQTGVRRVLVESAYWILPKPADLAKLQYQCSPAERAVSEMPAIKNYDPGEASVLSCAIFALLMLSLSALDIMKVDY